MGRMIVQHLHTGVSGKKPLPSGIMTGELAINYAANDETLFIKNSEEAIVEFKDDKYYQKQLSEKVDKTLSLTYSELVSLRDNSQLIPGQQYRITDYQCTTSQSGTQSAGHVFDIIVRADSENKLNEEAYAIQHTKDDIDYFANSELSAWKLWYCLDNDTARFAWADETETDGKPNGRGVIYRMIDEFGNDCPYDFKNIQFYRQWNEDKQLWCTISSDNTGVPCYTFSSFGDSSATSFIDVSLSRPKSIYSNVIEKYVTHNEQKLNNICFFGNYSYSNTFGNGCYNNTFGHSCIDNTFGSNCYNNIGNGFSSNIFGDDCYNNTFGKDCYYNIFVKRCYSNTFGNYCNYNIFEGYCRYNTFGNSCYKNTFGNDYYNNIFGNDCSFNTFENSCSGNTFGNDCSSNTFGSTCHSNTFRNGCSSNTFGNTCYSNAFVNHCGGNTFGNNCYLNTFRNDCNNNTFGNYCRYNTFGDYCRYNTFGNSCYKNAFGNDYYNNIFGNSCYSNIFGNYCDGNTFGNNCYANTFGNYCGNNTFGNICQNIKFALDISASTKYNYYQQNHFGDGCRYILFKGAETASSASQVQNYNFAQGLQGTSSAYLTIDGVRNRAYETKVAKKSNGEMKIYCEADLIL